MMLHTCRFLHVERYGESVSQSETLCIKVFHSLAQSLLYSQVYLVKVLKQRLKVADLRDMRLWEGRAGAQRSSPRKISEQQHRIYLSLITSWPTCNIVQRKHTNSRIAMDQKHLASVSVSEIDRKTWNKGMITNVDCKQAKCASARIRRWANSFRPPLQHKVTSGRALARFTGLQVSDTWNNFCGSTKSEEGIDRPRVYSIARTNSVEKITSNAVLSPQFVLNRWSWQLEFYCLHWSWGAIWGLACKNAQRHALRLGDVRSPLG